MEYTLCAFLGLFGTAHGWFLPGVAPHHFARGERVELKVNKLTSTQTQVKPILFPDFTSLGSWQALEFIHSLLLLASVLF